MYFTLSTDEAKEDERENDVDMESRLYDKDGFSRAKNIIAQPSENLAEAYTCAKVNFKANDSLGTKHADYIEQMGDSYIQVNG